MMPVMRLMEPSQDTVVHRVKFRVEREKSQNRDFATNGCMPPNENQARIFGSEPDLIELCGLYSFGVRERRGVSTASLTTKGIKAISRACLTALVSILCCFAVLPF